MRLVAITLRNFRGVTDSTVEFASGVTVVEGPNEAGKSSIPEALRLTREYKDSSNAAPIRTLQPVGQDVGPEVVVSLQAGKYQLTFRKRWIKGRMTELTVSSPDPEQLTGDEAHERYVQILRETTDLDLLAALEIVQGQSLEQASLAELPALQRALDSADLNSADRHRAHLDADDDVGDDSSHDSGSDSSPDALLARINKEYRRYFTPKGNATGDYLRISNDVAGLAEKLAELECDSRDVEQLEIDYRSSTERLAQLEEQQTTASSQLADLQSEREQLAGLSLAAEQATTALQYAQQQHATAVEAQQRRADLISQLTERTANVTDARDLVATTGRDHSDVQDALTTLRQQLSVTEADLTTARDTAVAIRAQADRRRARSDISVLKNRLKVIHEAQQSKETAAAIVAASPVDDTLLATLQDRDVLLRIVTGRRSDAAATVTVTVLGDHPVRVNNDDVARDDPHTSTALDSVSIDIPDIATILVEPGTPPAELDAAVTEAQTAFDQALKQAQVSSIAEARDSASRRTEAEQSRDAADIRLTQAIGEDSLAALQQQLAAAELRLSETEVSSDGATTAAGDAAAGDAADGLTDTAADAPAGTLNSTLIDVATSTELDRAVHDAEERAAHLDEHLKVARETLAARSSEAEEIRAAVERATANHESATAELNRTNTELSVARDTADDEQLSAAVTAAEVAVSDSRDQADVAQQTLAAAQPESLEMKLRNATALVESTDANLAAAEKDVIRFRDRLDQRLEQGIYDKVAEAGAAHEAATDRQRQLDRQAAAVNLLRTTMREHQDAAQKKYVAPLKTKTERLGRLVFGDDFSIEISDDLRIVSRTLGGDTVPFESLSAGAREQISLLGRLACAQLIDAEDGAPVILDDTLGFADPDRLEALNAVLHDVGNSAQVIVLTCQPQRFAGLGGATRVRLDGSRRA